MPTVQELARQIAVKRGLVLPDTDKSLWPAPYDEATAESCYRFLTECIWTFDESTGEDRPMPDKEYLKLIVEQWHECRRTGTPLHIVKSRRLVVSWAMGAIQLHEAGLKRGRYLIAAEVFEGNNGSCAFVHRQKYLYDQLRARKPDWKLDPCTATGGKGAAQSQEVVLPNGSMFIAGNSDPSKFQGSGAGHVLLEEASQYAEVERMLSQAGINTQGPPGEVGGLVVTISNATAQPEFLELMMPHDGERLLTYGVARARENMSGNKIIEVHYAADPEKGPEWAAEVKKSIPHRQWMREYEGEINAHDGEAVWPEYRAEYHRHNGLLPWPARNNVGWLVGGWDCGNTANPAFVLMHVLPGKEQQVHVLLEVVPDGPASMEVFAGMVSAKLDKFYPGWRAYQIDHQADPSGNSFQGNTGKSAFDIARSKGFSLRPSSNNKDERIGAVAWALSDWVTEGESPRIVISAEGCPTLIGAVSGGYAWRTDGGAGGYRVLREPRKDGWSHIADALQYAVMRARKLIQSNNVESPHNRGVRGRGTSGR